jgi:hypothetical protein
MATIPIFNPSYFIPMAPRKLLTSTFHVKT